MKTFISYNKLKGEFCDVILDDQIFFLLIERGTRLKWNNYGYPMIECYINVREKILKLKPLANFVYYYYYKEWAQQFDTAIHHLNQNKLDNRIENLQMVDWDDHKQIHIKDRVVWTPPAPHNMKVA